MKLVEVGGRTLAYRRTGDGPPLVLLHGGWSDGRGWSREHGWGNSHARGNGHR